MNKVTPALLITMTFCVGCGTSPGAYDATLNRPVLVPATMGWHRAGITREATLYEVNKCSETAETHPEYQRLMRSAKSVRMGKMGYTKEQRVVLGAPGRYEGKVIDACMAAKGFKFEELSN